jgi:hypothetical protein
LPVEQQRAAEKEEKMQKPDYSIIKELISKKILYYVLYKNIGRERIREGAEERKTYTSLVAIR